MPAPEQAFMSFELPDRSGRVFGITRVHDLLIIVTEYEVYLGQTDSEGNIVIRLLGPIVGHY